MNNPWRIENCNDHAFHHFEILFSSKASKHVVGLRVLYPKGYSTTLEIADVEARIPKTALSNNSYLLYIQDDKIVRSRR
jgi:hypothetical protein